MEKLYAVKLILSFSIFIISSIFPLFLRIILLTECLMHILHNQHYTCCCFYLEQYSAYVSYSRKITKFAKSNTRDQYTKPEEHSVCMCIRPIIEAFINTRSRSYGVSQVIVTVCKIKSTNIRGHFGT